MDYTFLLGSIENILGKSYKRARENHAFNCPFCNHHKPKLEINFRTNEKGQNPWECWVCETKGRTIRSLLYQLKIPRDQAKEVLRYVPKSSDVEYREIAAIQLPKEFKTLYNASSTSIIANKIKRYLYERGFSDNDFIKYNVGYCTAGEYGGRIIIPSYSESNILNYFIARTHEGSYHKYRNPEISKDIIFFENLINWNQPVVLCEGVFDAIAIKRNAIPILGKTLSNTLIKKVIASTNKDIYIALDTDARSKALGISEHLLSLGKRVFLVELTDKDPSDMGFEQFTKLVQTAKELDLSTLMMHKLEL
tara:strand:- start:17447 stop:18370 length:924 start_codon:yes stop_codon:yes gene_type:complete